MRNQRLHLHELDVSRARKAVDHTSERGEFYNHSRDYTLSTSTGLNKSPLKVSRKFKHEDNADCRRSDKKQPSFYNHALLHPITFHTLFLDAPFSSAPIPLTPSRTHLLLGRGLMLLRTSEFASARSRHGGTGIHLTRCTFFKHSEQPALLYANAALRLILSTHLYLIPIAYNYQPVYTGVANYRPCRNHCCFFCTHL